MNKLHRNMFKHAQTGLPTIRASKYRFKHYKHACLNLFLPFASRPLRFEQGRETSARPQALLWEILPGHP
jgi:hypothetical protein